MIVDHYCHLRQRDGQGSGKSTWRITVRQLESMIRLSEAMAKMECSDEVSRGSRETVILGTERYSKGCMS